MAVPSAGVVQVDPSDTVTQSAESHRDKPSTLKAGDPVGTAPPVAVPHGAPAPVRLPAASNLAQLPEVPVPSEACPYAPLPWREPLRMSVHLMVVTAPVSRKA